MLENNEYCSNCGARRSQSFKYCLHCGTSYNKTSNSISKPTQTMTIQKEIEKQPELVYCPSCGMKIIKEDIYCIECGNKNPVVKTQVNKNVSTSNSNQNSVFWTIMLILSILNAISLMPIAGIAALISLFAIIFSKELIMIFVLSTAYFVASIIFLVKSIKMNSKK